MGGRQTGLISGWVGFWGNLSVGTTPILVALIQHHSGSWTMALFLPAAMGLACATVWAFVRPDRAIAE
jgi:nitrate/nitrite transporter NarK